MEIDINGKSKGAFKYYISVFGGGGVLSQNTDIILERSLMFHKHACKKLTLGLFVAGEGGGCRGDGRCWQSPVTHAVGHDRI